MSMCQKCSGLIMEPDKSYGWAGPVCHCPEPQPAHHKHHWGASAGGISQDMAKTEIKAWEFIEFVKAQLKKRPHLKLHSIVVSDPEGRSTYRLTNSDRNASDTKETK